MHQNTVTALHLLGHTATEEQVASLDLLYNTKTPETIEELESQAFENARIYLAAVDVEDINF